MARHELRQHRAEQEGAGALERQLVDLDLDLDAAAEGDRPRQRQPAHQRPRRNPLQALDLPQQRGVADEFDALGRDYRMAAMDQTVGQAFRRHQRWTEEEMSVLRDGTKTALDKALELHRTFNGVSSKSIREGLSSLAP